MPSKIVQARNIRGNYVVLASTAEELVALLDLYEGTSASDPNYLARVTIQLLPIDYSFTESQLPLKIRSYMSLIGTGSQQTRLISAQTTAMGAKNVISCLDLWSSGVGGPGKVYHATLSGFTIVGDAYAPAAIYAKGLNNSIIRDIQIRAMTASGSIGVQLDAENTFGCYYNSLQSVEVGFPGVGDAAGIGFRLKTTDLGAQPSRVNSNSLVMCSAKWCVDAGYELNGTVATTMTACEAEVNAVGLRVLSSYNTVVTGGYFENNSSSDIQLGSLAGAPEASQQTVLMQPYLASTTRLAGQSRGSTGDMYVIANDGTNPSATKYDGQWMDKSHIGALSAGFVDHAAYSSAVRVGYYKLSGDANYRLEVFNNGNMKWGSGSAVTDTELFRAQADVLALANNDSFRLNGTAWIIWSSSSGASADVVMHRMSADILGLANSDSFQVNGTGQFLFSTATASAADAGLARDGAGAIAARLGAQSHVLRVYNTYTDASNYERGNCGFVSDVYTIGSYAAGTGTLRDIHVGVVGNKIGFYGTTAIVQPTTGFAEAAFVENAGGVAVNDDSTFDGYTLRQVVAALRALGLLQ